MRYALISTIHPAPSLYEITKLMYENTNAVYLWLPCLQCVLLWRFKAARVSWRCLREAERFPEGPGWHCTTTIYVSTLLLPF